MSRRLRDVTRRLPRVRTQRGRAVPTPPRAGRATRRRTDRPLPLALLLVLGCAAALALPVAAVAQDDEPDRLDQAQLTGDRQLQAPLCLALLPDLSGSMAELAGVRRQAVASLVEFAQRELRPDDRLAVAGYAGDADLVHPFTPLAELGGTLAEGSATADGTRLLPAVQAVLAGGAADGCGAVLLASVTDAELQDDPNALQAALHEGAVTRLAVLVPDGSGSRPGLFRHRALHGVQVESFSSGDADALAVVYGRLLAEVLGQELRVRS